MRLDEITQPILRQDIIQALEKIRPRVMNTDKPMSYRRAATMLEKALSPWEVSFSSQINDEIPKDEIYITGEYRPELDQDDATDPIELKIIHRSDDTMLGDGVEDREWFYKTVVNYIAGALVHEVIHMNQNRARNFNMGGKTLYKSKATDTKIKQAQEYLGNKDELEAYAYNLADELLQKYSKNEAIKILTHKQPLQNLQQISPILYSHLVIFNNDISNPVTRRLLKKAIRYIEIISSQNKA